MSEFATLTFVQCERDGERVDGATPHYEPKVKPQQEETGKVTLVHLLGLVFLSVMSILAYNLGA